MCIAYTSANIAYDGYKTKQMPKSAWPSSRQTNTLSRVIKGKSKEYNSKYKAPEIFKLILDKKFVYIFRCLIFIFAAPQSYLLAILQGIRKFLTAFRHNNAINW